DGDADFARNGGGERCSRDSKYLLNGIQPSEKVYQSFRLEVRNGGGHSSRPVKDNAIYHLADGLTRLAKYQFPVHLNEVTAGYFQRMSGAYTGLLAVDMRGIRKNPGDKAAISRLSTPPYENALLRTTW